MSEYFFVKFTKNHSNKSRFAFIVSSKNIKKAVGRNLLKRRAREIIRKNLDKIRKGHNISFTFSAKAKNLDYNLLEKEIAKVLWS